MSYILCVDDEASIAALVRHILVLAGHEVKVAANGQQALQFVAEREPELVVLDWSMPFMDGLAVCQAIKANPFHSRIPVLMLTAQATVEDKVRGFEAGADDYLIKPFEPRELTARVSALLRLVQREGDRNPSSGLPGGRAISAEMDRWLAKDKTFAVLYFDLDHFKPFADSFGFGAADAIITGLGGLLGALAVQFEAFASHIGGDDFLVLAPSHACAALASEALHGYRSIVQKVVGPTVAATGSFAAADREGVARVYPLAQLTAVQIQVDRAHWVSLAHLGETAAATKKRARLQGHTGLLVAAAGPTSSAGTGTSGPGTETNVAV